MKLARLTLLAAVLALLVSGCSSTGGMLGGGTPNSNPTTSTSPRGVGGETVRGTVQGVDPQARTITLAPNATGGSKLRSADRTVLSYDQQTQLEYKGQMYNNPQDLEAGDQIDAVIERSADRLLARRIVVRSSVSDPSGAASGPGGVPIAFDATVNAVNAANRTIEVVQSGRQQFPISVQYDANTRVDYQGRAYRPEDLERGDGVRIIPRGPGEPVVAAQIIVTDNAGAGTGARAPAAGQRQLHGTVRNIDPNTRTLSLDSVSWAQGFDKNAPGASATVKYDSNTVVEYQGQRYGVANIEPGDVASVDVTPSGDGYLANRIVVEQSR